MTEIEIDVKAKIFDDPEYCEADKEESCQRVDILDFDAYRDSAYCQLFRNSDNSFIELEQSEKSGKFKKCQQCKEAWQKVLSAEGGISKRVFKRPQKNIDHGDQ
jgi:hypothetical protein